MQTIVCKATFELLPGVAKLSQTQDQPNENEDYWNDDPARSLHASSDLVPFKPRADVLLVGHAFAPRREAVRSLLVRLVVGSLDKSIEVFGDRIWTGDGTVSEAAWFTSMPLLYERAAGGPGTSNPVGVSSESRPGIQGLLRLPNLQPPGAAIRDCSTPTAAAGFGPIAPSWPERRSKLGPLAGRWPDEHWHLRPMPEELDPSYYNAAPADQQLDALAEDARILLEHLHPEHARLETSLPGLRPRARLEIPGTSPQEVRMRCDTLWIDTVRAVCTLVWRGQIPLEGREQLGRVVVGMEEPGRPTVWRYADSEALSSGRDHGGSTAKETHHWSERGALDAVDPTETQPIAGQRLPVLPFAAQDAVDNKGPTRVSGSRPSATPDVAPPLLRTPAPMALDVTQAPPLVPTTAANPGEPSKWPSLGPPAPYSPEVPEPPLMRALREGADWAGVPAVTETKPAAKPSVKPTATSERHDVGRQTALESVLAVSNAAAAANPKAEPSVRKDPRVAEAPARGRPREIVELIWYDPSALPRIRRHLAWKRTIAELAPRPSDDDFDGGLPPEQMKAAKDKRDVLGVLARGEATDLAGIRRSIEMAILDDGSLVPPYVLTAGVMEFQFDEVEKLRALLVMAVPLLTEDKRLKEMADTAAELLKTPGVERGRGVVEALAARIKMTIEQASRGIPAGSLESQVEAMLLEGRCYQTRVLMGEKKIRAMLVHSDSEPPVPAYLPSALGVVLPMFQRFRVRAVAGARARLDQSEKADIALQVVALAQVTGRRN